jgi:ABC-type lipoprotein export system ATPase subunit/GNAT superfamily N-acetyltransferase
MSDIFEFEDEPVQLDKLTSKVEIDDIVAEISNVFDYEFDGTSEFQPWSKPKVPEDFGIGLIVGGSGSGKSTLLKEFGSETTVEWNSNKAVASHFDSSEDAQDKLAAVGFNSIGDWVKPYHVLSNGQQFRADLARRLADNAIIDEFTSVVDRNVAKSCSVALRRWVDKSKTRGLVLSTCHFDIIEWLQPDWTFNCDTGELLVGRCERPDIRLEIIPCGEKAWSAFSKHHYLDGTVNKASLFWIAIWNDIPVGMVAALSMPNPFLKRAWRESRLVVLPEFQGLGLGTKLSEAVAQIFIDRGCRYFSKTSHPRLGGYRENSSLWKPTSKNKQDRKDYLSDRYDVDGGTFRYHDRDIMEKHSGRVCFSHEYIGLKRDITSDIFE